MTRVDTAEQLGAARPERTREGGLDVEISPEIDTQATLARQAASAPGGDIAAVLTAVDADLRHTGIRHTACAVDITTGTHHG